LNSYVVQLKGKSDAGIKSQVTRFNSYVVQLKD